MTSCRFSRWRISAILDFRGPMMGSLKSPRTTAYRSSIETTALNCLVFWENRVFCILATDRQTDKQMDKPVAWSLSRCRERRLNKNQNENQNEKAFIAITVKITEIFEICQQIYTRMSSKIISNNTNKNDFRWLKSHINRPSTRQAVVSFY